jgi:hypothetical protein
MNIHHLKTKFSQSSKIIVAFVVATAFLTQVIPASKADAAQITTRSLTLQAVGAVGGSLPGGAVNHAFAFTLPGGNTVGSIKFEYCTLASGTCNLPSGLVTNSGSSIGGQTGVTGFTLNNTTNGAPYLTRTAAAIGSSVATTYRLDNITNPDPVNGMTFFVRISTYASIDTTGGIGDDGVVAAATNRAILLTGTMPESLVFCTGATVGTTSSVPDCSTVTTGAVAFNQLFSPTDTATATSQMAASTNAGTGYIITVNGNTLASGTPTITGMAARTTSIKGIGQFGLNLKLNTTATSTVAVGLEVAAASDGTNYKGQAVGDYAVVDEFKFVTGETVANAANGGSNGPSNSQIFTVSYIANVPGNQPAGTYTTTLTYICTPTF